MNTTTVNQNDPVLGYSNPKTLWTRTNVAEAAPDIMSPLCWSVWGTAMEIGARAYLYRFGAITKDETKINADQNLCTVGVMYGQMLMNIDVQRQTVGKILGVDADDWERELCGSVREDAEPVKTNPLRIPLMLVKTLRTMSQATSGVEAVYPGVESWWSNDVFAVHVGERPAKGTPIERLRDANERFREIFAAHLVVRIQLQAVQTAVSKAAANAGDPSLALRAISGQADLPELVMADDLQRLGRNEISELEFLRLYGFHGPNEGNVYTKAWRENPERLRQLAKTAATRTDVESPQARRDAGLRDSRAAQEELLASTSGRARKKLRKTLDSASQVTRALERGKRGYLMALDGVRAAARDLGELLVAEGKLAEIDDVFFFTRDELEQLANGGLPVADDLVHDRRANREVFERVTMPVLTTGIPPLGDVLDVAGPASTGAITGLDSGGGIVEGRARIVTDPNDDIDFDEGDILVCRVTDPGWAPIFPLVEALVIDIGTSASHGAIVAREMGMTYVIGTDDATSRIPEGASIRVDGTNNLVTVL